MMPGRYDLEFYQGDYWTQTFVLGEQTDPDDPTTFTPKDLTDHTAVAVIKTGRKKEEVVATLVCSVDDLPAEGKVKVELMPTEAAKLVKGGVWDLKVIDPEGRPQTWLTGDVAVTLDV